MDVPKNRGNYPKMDGLQWNTLLKWMIWGYHYFWKHPHGFDSVSNFCNWSYLGMSFLAKVHGKRVPKVEYLLASHVPYRIYNVLLGQWLNFKLFGITYLVGKIKFTLFFQGPLAE